LIFKNAADMGLVFGCSCISVDSRNYNSEQH